MKYYRNKDYGINLTQIGVVFSEIQLHKFKLAKNRKRWKLSCKFEAILQHLPVLKNEKVGLNLLGDLQLLHIFF